MGCFADERVAGLGLTRQFGSAFLEVESLDACRDVCAEAGATHFALQGVAALECRCGGAEAMAGSMEHPRVDESDCGGHSWLCPAGATCGGAWRNSVFTVAPREAATSMATLLLAEDARRKAAAKGASRTSALATPTTLRLSAKGTKALSPEEERHDATINGGMRAVYSRDADGAALVGLHPHGRLMHRRCAPALQFS